MVKWQEKLYSHPFTHGEFWAKMRSLNKIINADIGSQPWRYSNALAVKLAACGIS
ncbi:MULTISPECIES: hypothetical protein [unclassified Nostoc]|uniref:hypothetical protein n=1 Tax=unclassified Nostoc TaxID=2593658 RepID=UPI0013D407E8|nr:MULTISPECIES: hypothetical protein [unclassified Nostoc]MBE9000540.1 hypothetical protein [Nostoc sp. LEGE 12447]NEU82643.1 hypothetical protein [Nostoc sp. UIC 10630]